MLIRCPKCRTRFRIYPEQLEVAGGRVRCSRCQAVFDTAPPEHDSARELHRVEHDAEPASISPFPEPAPERSRSWATASWGFGLAFLILTLGLQAVWWDRHALAAHPSGLPVVRWLCRYAPCEVRPPKAVDAILVPERTLEPHPERTDALRFSLRMVNQAELPQPYPILELTLLDRLGRLAGMRRFAPDQYLPPQAADLMAPGEPTEISLDLAAPEEQVIGFQIDFL